MTTPTPRPAIIEAKVKTSAAAAALSGLVLSLLAYLFHGTDIPDALKATITSVVTTLVTGGITYGVGWLTRHTPRDVLDLHTDN
ncbi:hypothetical protein [Actinophytocola sediminis]